MNKANPFPLRGRRLLHKRYIAQRRKDNAENTIFGWILIIVVVLVLVTYGIIKYFAE